MKAITNIVAKAKKKPAPIPTPLFELEQVWMIHYYRQLKRNLYELEMALWFRT